MAQELQTASFIQEHAPAMVQELPLASFIPDHIKSFAVYGTLRPDDDSKAEWTQRFIQTMSAEARSAKVFGCSMWTKKKKSQNYPCAIRSEDQNSFIYVKVLQFALTFDQKLDEADEIEQYDRWAPENSWYVRKIVDACLVDENDELTGEKVQAVMYFVPQLEENVQYFAVPEGNWLKREVDFVCE